MRTMRLAFLSASLDAVFVAVSRALSRDRAKRLDSQYCSSAPS